MRERVCARVCVCVCDKKRFVLYITTTGNLKNALRKYALYGSKVIVKEFTVISQNKIIFQINAVLLNFLFIKKFH